MLLREWLQQTGKDATADNICEFYYDTDLHGLPEDLAENACSRQIMIRT